MTEFPPYPVPSDPSRARAPHPPLPVPPVRYPTLRALAAAPPIPVAARLFGHLALSNGEHVGFFALQERLWVLVEEPPPPRRRYQPHPLDVQAVVMRSVLLWERALLASREGESWVMMLDDDARRLSAAEIAQRIREASPR